IRVRGQNQFCFAPRRSQRRHRESPFGAVVPRKHKFPPSERHPVQLGRIIQTEQTVFHAAVGGEFREHRRQVAARTLYPAGRVQFGKESNKHAESLPSTANDGKPGCSRRQERPARSSSFPRARLRISRRSLSV